MKEASKTTKPAVKVKDIAPKKDAKGGKSSEHAMKHTPPSRAAGHGHPGAAK